MVVNSVGQLADITKWILVNLYEKEGKRRKIKTHWEGELWYVFETFNSSSIRYISQYLDRCTKIYVLT